MELTIEISKTGNLLGNIFPKEVKLIVKDEDNVEIGNSDNNSFVWIRRKNDVEDLIQEVKNHKELSLAEDLEDGEVFFTASENYSIGSIKFKIEER